MSESLLGRSDLRIATYSASDEIINVNTLIDSSFAHFINDRHEVVLPREDAVHIF